MPHDEMPDAPKKRRTLKEFFDSSLFFRVLLGVMVFACCLFATAPRKEHEMQKLVINQVSPINLCADFDFWVEDNARTEASRAAAERQIPNYYQIRTDLTKKIQQRSEEFFSEVKNRENAERSGQSYKPAAENIPGQWVKELSSGALNFFLRLADNPPRMKKYNTVLQNFLQSGILSDEDFEEVVNQDRVIRIVDPLQRRSETNAAKVLTPGRCAKQITALLLDSVDRSEQKKISESAERVLLRILGSGNLVYDNLFTDSQKSEAAARVPVIRRQIFAGTMLLHKGTALTEEDLDLYKSYMAEKAKLRSIPVWTEILRENFLPCLILIIVLCVYLWYMQEDLLRHNRSLWLLGIILILGMLLNRFFFTGLLILAEHTDFPHKLIYLCLPIGFTATLISVIFGIRTSLICGLFVSVVAALSCPNPFQMMLLGFLISSGGSLAVRKTLNYRSFFLNCFWGTALGALMIVLIFLIREQNILQMLWRGLIPLSAVACMGLITAMLTQMTLILLEIFFDLNTTMSLKNCCDYNHPLLKDMQLKAPGTYHHCLMVATLAEQAAQDAGLDPVKARACGLFHDIGKIVQPEFFIENNRSGVDMHRDMDPTMSAMIIRSHVVTHGVELARKYKLKKILCDAITQHHGNDLIAFFHKKAQTLSPGGHVSEKEFRYPCSLPSDKEICLVMLSDCCEAASRSLDHPTPEALSELISEIFRKKIRSGQLDASKLTMSEISRIRKSFVNTLEHMYHGRIVYPKDENQDENDLFVASGKTLQKT